MADTETINKPRCPNCKSCEVIPLLGVLPGFQPYQTADVGRIPAAQCLEAEDEAPRDWHCEDCGTDWTEEGPPSDQA